ncbi:MAG: RagB/SusD family nutrient uptake outer membrane protein [Clostridia bacterium]
MAAISRPWGHFCGTMQVAQAPWLLEELSADGACWCQKGRHGYDGGDWIRLHRHEWTPTEARVERAWSLMYMGIGLANNLLADISKLDFEALDVPMSKDQTIAEIRVYRSFCYWYLMDLYGDVPIVETLDELNPETKTRTEVFNYIEKELTESIPSLSEDLVKTYGRVSKWGAYALLSRMYLNAKIYTGKDRFDDCIAASDAIINSNKFQLDEKWNTPFCANNDKLSKENIWVIIYDQVYAHGMGWYQRWLHYAHQKAWNLQSGTWNGLVTQPSFFDTFKDNDLRKIEGFLIGKQYPRKKDDNGNYYFDTTQPPLLGSEEYKGEPLVLVNYIEAMDKGEENSGARSVKYEVAEGSTGNQDNDWVIFRLGEVISNKAEALMRKNGGTANAEVVTLVNSIKQRAFKAEDWDEEKYTISTLNLDEMLKERGREFAFEGFRRVDLVRYGKFVTTPWWDFTPNNNEAYNLFPIPQKQLDANQNLKPNMAN